MTWVLGALLWYAFDDHLAESIGVAGLGDVQLWVVLLAALALHLVTAADAVERIKEMGRSLERGRPKAG